MKALVGCIVFVSFIALASCEATAEEKNIFKEWRRKHCKKYRSLEEELEALDQFLENKQEVDEHNKLYDQGKETYKKKIWEYSDLSKEDKRKYLHGVKVPDEHKYGGRYSRNAENYPHFPAGPAAIDWTKKGLVGPVENQGQCGSCWAFSAAAIVEAVLRKKYHNKALVSPQQLIDCSHFGSNGCSGGWPEYALDYIKANGVTDEEEYPYVGYERTCEYTQSEKIGSISCVHNIPTRGNETWMKDIVAGVGPVSVVICIEDSFYDYSEGVYNPQTCCTAFDHAPVVVGYGTDPVGGDYWLVKNSWGLTFGDNGYIKMARNRDNLCNIAYYALYAS